MKNTILPLSLVLAFISILALACTVPAPQVIATQTPAPKKEISSPSWQSDWNTLVAEAQKEGKVSLYTSMGTGMRTLMGDILKKNYGLELDFVSGRTAEVLAKISAERRAGLYLADAYVGGNSSQLTLKDSGALRPILPLLLLPEVTDSKMWDGGQMTFLDGDKLILPFVSHVNLPFVINTDLVKTPPGFKDLLGPQWKGKILMHDPTQSGSGNQFITVVFEMHGESAVRQLAQQEPTLVRDYRTHMEWVARGKFPIGTGPSTENIAEFRRMGAPIATPVPADLSYLSTGVGMVSMLSNPAHPAAAKVFVNWLLSKEGQTAYAKGMGDQSRRLDVTTEYTMPDMVRQPGVSYFNVENEEIARKSINYMKLDQEIFGPFLK